MSRSNSPERQKYFPRFESLPPLTSAELSLWVREKANLPVTSNIQTAQCLQEPAVQNYVADQSENFDSSFFQDVQKIYIGALKQLSGRWRELSSQSRRDLVSLNAAQAEVLGLHAAFLESLLLAWKWRGEIPEEAQVSEEYLLPRYTRAVAGEVGPGDTSLLFSKVMGFLFSSVPEHQAVVRHMVLTGSFTPESGMNSNGAYFSTYQFLVWKSLEAYLAEQSAVWHSAKPKSEELWRAQYNHQRALSVLLVWGYNRILLPEMELDDDHMYQPYVREKETAAKMLESGKHPLEVMVSALKKRQPWQWRREELRPFLDTAWHPSNIPESVVEKFRPEIINMLLHLLYEFVGDWRSIRQVRLLGKVPNPLTLKEITDQNQCVDQYCLTLRLLLEWGWNSTLDVEAELPDRFMPSEYLAHIERIQTEYERRVLAESTDVGTVDFPDQVRDVPEDLR